MRCGIGGGSRKRSSPFSQAALRPGLDPCQKLVPRNYRKLDCYLVGAGRFREFPHWRKDFKAALSKALDLKTPITPRPGSSRRNGRTSFPWSRASSSFQVQYSAGQAVVIDYLPTSRFLICKHLVQGFVPLFVIALTRIRTSPIWVVASEALEVAPSADAAPLQTHDVPPTKRSAHALFLQGHTSGA